MSVKFKNKYTIKSARLEGHDYSQNGMYFVTICTINRQAYFGEIIDGKIRLSEIGKTAENSWREIPKHFPNVRLDEFIVMPNHIHGIIEIINVETQNFASLPQGNAFGPQSKNLASIVRGFKIGVKKYTTKNEIYFQWQSRYYDRIIRDERELNRIREYIFNNPKNWEEDRNNPENLMM